MIPKQYPVSPSQPIDTPPRLRYAHRMDKHWIMKPKELTLKCGERELAWVWRFGDTWYWQTIGGKWGEARYSNWACMEAEREVRE